MLQVKEAVQWSFTLSEDGTTPVPCADKLVFQAWMAEHQAQRFVGDTSLMLHDRQVRVATIFLGRRLDDLKGEPVLFETRCYLLTKEFLQRYQTWEQAAAGHAMWVGMIEGCGYKKMERPEAAFHAMHWTWDLFKGV